MAVSHKTRERLSGAADDVRLSIVEVGDADSSMVGALRSIELALRGAAEAIYDLIPAEGEADASPTDAENAELAAEAIRIAVSSPTQAELDARSDAARLEFERAVAQRARMAKDPALSR